VDIKLLHGATMGDSNVARKMRQHYWPPQITDFFAFRAPIQETPKINILIPKKKKKKQES
jgi:hypothetical protein